MQLGLENINTSLFLLLNATPRTAPWLVEIAIAVAEWAIYLVPLCLAWLWLRGDPARRSGLVMACLAAQAGLLVNQILPFIWFHPRPFMVPIGHTFIDHAAESSFASDHAIFIFATSLGLAIWYAKRLPAIGIFLIGLAVAWARIFVGVHFPFDMAGAMVVAGFSLAIVAPVKGFVDRVAMPSLLLPLYRRAFGLPIRRGWFVA